MPDVVVPFIDTVVMGEAAELETFKKQGGMVNGTSPSVILWFPSSPICPPLCPETRACSDKYADVRCFFRAHGMPYYTTLTFRWTSSGTSPPICRSSSLE